MIDYAEIKVASGKGGDGLSHFMRIKYNAWAGPDGGNGGKGGDVYIVGSSKIKTLSHFRRKKYYKSLDGQEGQQNFKSGRNSPYLELKVPIGTLVTNSDTHKLIADVSRDDQRVLLAAGGTGGRGNASFKSSTNQAPDNKTFGNEGESLNLRLELKLLSDVGFVGLPSVGKSSLLNFMTGSKSKTAEYRFTTLEPSIGVLKLAELKTLVLADLPGLIEGASEGRGLGEAFLKHVERSGLMVHVLDPFQNTGFTDKLSTEDIMTNLLNDYQVIRKEMQKWDKKILSKYELLLLNKSDLLKEGQAEDILFKLEHQFVSKYEKISESMYINTHPFKNSKIPVGIAYCSTYSGFGVTDVVNFFNTYYDNIIQGSQAQIVEESEQKSILEININNLPNKRIFFKFDKIIKRV
ncbi:GTPase ObgE [bacterium]|nr:GTPase ObgE [bacterium]